MATSVAPTPHALNTPEILPAEILPAEIPRELDRWNWGAFFLNWIWGLGNNTFIALLMFVPVVNIVMLFVLGAKGSAWAWRNGRWTGVEHFKRVQRRWAIWGLIAWLATIPLVALMLVGIVAGLSDSQAYKLAVNTLSASPEVIAVVGTPVSAGMAMGSVSDSGSTGDADLNFTFSGPKGSGAAEVKALKTFDEWTLTSLRFKPKDAADAITVVSAGQASAKPRIGPLRLLVSGTETATTKLRPQDSKVELKFGIARPQVGSVITAVWRQRDVEPANEGMNEKVSLTLENDQSDSATFTVNRKSDWSAGRYRIDVSVDDVPARSLDFTVAGP